MKFLEELNQVDLKECNGGNVPASTYMSEDTIQGYGRVCDAVGSFVSGFLRGFMQAF